MPIKILGCGASVILDDEDYELVTAHSWHVYAIRGRTTVRKPAVARLQMRYGRQARLHLHREVAIRADPSIIKKKFQVRARNGDYLDCRRENLEVRIQRQGPGRPKLEPRPIGWKQRDVQNLTRPRAPASPSWAGGVVYRKIDRGRGATRTRRTVPLIGNTPAPASID